MPPSSGLKTIFFSHRGENLKFHSPMFSKAAYLNGRQAYALLFWSNSCHWGRKVATF
jgi:hypothetical protein